jgi:acyl carrier protein
VTPAEIRKLACGLLAAIAPEADLAALGEDEPLRAALDIDSLDFLNFVAALHKATGIDIPEADYRELFTLAGIARYLGRDAA